MDHALQTANEIIMDHDTEDRPVPSGGRLLTTEEWAKVMPPLVSIKVEFKEWGDVEYEIGLKYALRIATGWVYFTNKRYVFEKTEDYMAFKLWLSKNPMVDSDIEIE